MAEQRHDSEHPQAGTKTEGAIKGGGGRYVFDMARLSALDAGPGYSTAHGPVVEGERMQIGLLRMPRGTGGRPHSHRTSSGCTCSRAPLRARWTA